MNASKYTSEEIYQYTREELTKTARAAVKGRGVYRKWEIKISNRPRCGDAVSLVVHFTCKQNGQAATTSVRL